MFTTEGQVLVKRFLANHVGSYAEAVGVGIGTTAASGTDVQLDFEVARADVSLSSYDFENDLAIFKATLPSEVSGKFYELGLFSLDTTFVPTELLVGFEDDEAWDVATWSTTVARIGTQSLFHTPALSTTSSSTMTDVHYDLSKYNAGDIFKLAVDVGNSNTSSITVRFMTDASNYYTVTQATPSVAYHLYQWTKGSASSTGNPDWSEISQIQVRTTSTSGGASAVRYDGLIVQESTIDDPEYTLVARNVLGSPITKEEGVELDIEFTLSVAIA